MDSWKGAEDKENERLWSMGASSSLGNCRVQITRDSKLHKRKRSFLAGGKWPGNDACLRRQIVSTPGKISRLWQNPKRAVGITL